MRKPLFFSSLSPEDRATVLRRLPPGTVPAPAPAPSAAAVAPSPLGEWVADPPEQYQGMTRQQWADLAGRVLPLYLRLHAQLAKRKYANVPAADLELWRAITNELRTITP
jgi:hypothetical protein